jgi:hypothetical protein
LIAGETIWQLVVARAAATPEALFAVDERERTLTFATYRDAALRAAAGLHERGIGAGTPVSWMLPTTLESLVLAGALARLGAVQNPILPIYRERETRFIARQTGARLLCVPPPFRGFDYPALASALASELSGLDTLIVDGSLPEADPRALPPPARRDDRRPRARALDLLHVGHHLGSKGRAAHRCEPDRELPRLVRVLDLRPTTGTRSCFRSRTWAGRLADRGAARGLRAHRRAIFDPKRTIPLLARHGVTQAGAGTVFHQAYLAAQREQPGRADLPARARVPGRRRAEAAAAALRPEARARRRGIVSGYGLTECPIIAMNTRARSTRSSRTRGPAESARGGGPRRALRRQPGRAGRGGRAVLCAGRSCAAGTSMRASTPPRSTPTASSARRPRTPRLDGYLVITGRTKDVIIRKGENISAKEVEDVLYTHAKVSDVAVIGCPIPRSASAPVRWCRVAASRSRSPRWRSSSRSPGSRARRFPSSSRSWTRCRATPRARSRSSCYAIGSAERFRRGSLRARGARSRARVFGVGFAREKNSRTVIGRRSGRRRDSDRCRRDLAARDAALERVDQRLAPRCARPARTAHQLGVVRQLAREARHDRAERRRDEHLEVAAQHALEVGDEIRPCPPPRGRAAAERLDHERQLRGPAADRSSPCRRRRGSRSLDGQPE